jgi:hypothetical protein
MYVAGTFVLLQGLNELVPRINETLAARREHYARLEREIQRRREAVRDGRAQTLGTDPVSETAGGEPDTPKVQEAAP